MLYSRRFKREGERTESFYQVHCQLSSINFSTENFNMNKTMLPASNSMKALELVQNEEKIFSESS